MRFIGLMLLFTTSISGCTNEKAPEEALVSQFWNAVMANDVNTLSQVIVNPESAEFFAKGSGFSLAVDEFEVLENVDGDVKVKFTRFCYPDGVAPTKVVATDGGPKVDVMATIQAVSTEFSGVERSEKYCFKFAEQTLQGVINGQPWEVHHAERQSFDFGSRKEERISLVSEACPADNCFSLETPSITIGRLNLNSDGGNFSNTENITIFIPPNNNQIVSEGSYRVSEAESGDVKLEISFKLDEENHLSGFVLL